MVPEQLGDDGLLELMKPLPRSQMPLRAHRDTIAESLFELRFTPAQTGVGELLPGVLFSELRSEYPTSRKLPLAAIAAEIREQDEGLRYQPIHRLAGEEATVVVGDRMIGLAKPAPYDGWVSFHGRVMRLLDAVAGVADLLETVERFSLKVTNVIPKREGLRQLQLIRFEGSLAESVIPETGFRFRTELNDEHFHRIVNLSPDAVVQRPEGRQEGLLVQLDVIGFEPERFLDSPEEHLEKVHTHSKSLFFQLITQDTLEYLQPEYPQDE